MRAERTRGDASRAYLHTTQGATPRTCARADRRGGGVGSARDRGMRGEGTRQSSSRGIQGSRRFAGDKGAQEPTPTRDREQGLKPTFPSYEGPDFS